MRAGAHSPSPSLHPSSTIAILAILSQSMVLALRLSSLMQCKTMDGSRCGLRMKPWRGQTSVCIWSILYGHKINHPSLSFNSIKGERKTGDQVNLERAMGAHVRFGGHFVQVHPSPLYIVFNLISSATLGSRRHNGDAGREETRW